MWNKSKIDLKQLEYELKHLKSTQRLYKLLRDELSRQGHWRNLPRGKPFVRKGVSKW
jgi:hypothetical protein